MIHHFERPYLIYASICSGVKLQAKYTMTLLLLNGKIYLLLEKLHKCHTTKKRKVSSIPTFNYTLHNTERTVCLSSVMQK